MTGAMLATATLTGVFCMGFSLVVGLATDALSFLAVLVFSFLSGFCGSLFAQTVMKRRGR